MGQPQSNNERLPRVAIVGLFQGGKSLLINAALGGSFVPVGKFGLRTTPCRIRCLYGELNRAVSHEEGSGPRGISIRAVSAYIEALTPDELLISMDFFLSHPLLRKIELSDTPGIDYSEGDNDAALAAARDADAVVLVIQQSLPAASNSFKNLTDCLQGKSWGMVLNCGRAGPHLEYPDSRASMEVEEICLRQLLESGLPEPVFSQRMSARTLSYYASEQFAPEKTMNMSEEHQDDLAADEESIRDWRENLIHLGGHWENQRLEDVRQRILQLLEDQKWSEPSFRFNREKRSFSCRVGYDGWEYRVTGCFCIEAMTRYDRVRLYDFGCSEQWVVDWLDAQRDWRTWKL